MGLPVDQMLLYMIFAAILGIVYSLKRMFLLEKKIAAMEIGIGKLLEKIEREEANIERKLGMKKKKKK